MRLPKLKSKGCHLALALAGVLATTNALAVTYKYRVGSRGVVAPGTSITLAGRNSVNLRTFALAAGWGGTAPLTVTVTSTIGALNSYTPALTIDGSFPGGVTLIINSGVYIAGGGGPGGSFAGQAGGPALLVSAPVNIVNNGIIGGGGGGGQGDGNGGDIGGGGAGSPPGAYGYGATLTKGADTDRYNMWFTSRGGAIGQPGGFIAYSGSGGGLGAAGGGANGGAAGFAVMGNSNVTWTVPGTRYGPSN